jgi:hypothetical protein
MNSLLRVANPQASSRRPALAALALSALVSLVVLLPFFCFGSASGHDFEFHVASWLDVAYQWQHGVHYPHWTVWTNYGFGEPRYIFYPPLSWLLGAALACVLPVSWVPGAFIFLTQTLAGLSAFFLLRRLVCLRAACLGAAFYAANPYALLLSYIRSDFAEQLACAIFPWLVLSTLRIADLLADEPRKTSSVPVFAIPFAAIWLCNAPAGVIASYSVTLLFAWAALTQGSWKIVLRSASAIVLGLGLSAFYLLPAAYEQRWVNIAQALSSGLRPGENFLFTQIDDIEHTWFNWISSFCALILILLSAFAALASRKFSGKVPLLASLRSVWGGLLALGFAAALVMLRLSIPLWNLLPKLRYVQFPWRWMSVLAVICACFFAAAIERRRGWLCFAFFVAFSIPLGVFLAQNTWWDADEMSTQQAAITSGDGYEGVDEYDPQGDDHLDLPKQAPLASMAPASGEDADTRPLGGKIQVEGWQPTDKRIQVWSARPGRVALRLLNYPAWQVTVNGVPVRPERADDVDQMLVPVSAGQSEIRVRFVRTPDRTVGLVFSLISLVAGLAMLRWPRSREN